MNTWDKMNKFICEVSKHLWQWYLFLISYFVTCLKFIYFYYIFFPRTCFWECIFCFVWQIYLFILFYYSFCLIFYKSIFWNYSYSLTSRNPSVLALEIENVHPFVFAWPLLYNIYKLEELLCIIYSLVCLK